MFFFILVPCICTDEYNITIANTNVYVEAYCNHWDKDGSWCYLAYGLDAEHCPKARESKSGAFYWTKDTAICKAAESNRKGSMYDSKYF